MSCLLDAGPFPRSTPLSRPSRRRLAPRNNRNPGARRGAEAARPSPRLPASAALSTLGDGIVACNAPDSTPAAREGTEIKTILLPFNDEPQALCALEQACVIAHRFDSHIEGLYFVRRPQILPVDGIALAGAGAYIACMKDEDTGHTEAVRGRFTELMAERGIPIRPLTEAGSGPSASFESVEGFEAQIVGDRARLFDITVIGRTSDQAVTDWEAMCESVFFESGRPVLLAAPETPKHFGRNVVIHWNASHEAARTIAAGMPFLREADQVFIVTVAGAELPGPSAEAMVANLVRSGISAESRAVEAEGRSAGEALLDTAKSVGADLMVKGAYTRSRLRQLVFGGITRHVLSHAELPVVMAH